MIMEFLSEARGENVAEYSFILGFISLGIVASAILMGNSFEAVWQALGTSIVGLAV